MSSSFVPLLNVPVFYSRGVERGVVVLEAGKKQHIPKMLQTLRLTQFEKICVLYFRFVREVHLIQRFVACEFGHDFEAGLDQHAGVGPASKVWGTEGHVGVEKWVELWN